MNDEQPEDTRCLSVDTDMNSLEIETKTKLYWIVCERL